MFCEPQTTGDKKNVDCKAYTSPTVMPALNRYSVHRSPVVLNSKPKILNQVQDDGSFGVLFFDGVWCENGYPFCAVFFY